MKVSIVPKNRHYFFTQQNSASIMSPKKAKREFDALQRETIIPDDLAKVLLLEYENEFVFEYTDRYNNLKGVAIADLFKELDLPRLPLSKRHFYLAKSGADTFDVHISESYAGIAPNLVPVLRQPALTPIYEGTQEWNDWMQKYLELG